MAAPSKPWERSGVNNHQQNTVNGLPSSSSWSGSITSAAGGGGGSYLPTSLPPAVPPRPSEQSSSMMSYTNGGMYGNMHSGYGMYNSMYGGGGMYGSGLYAPTGMYGSGMYGGQSSYASNMPPGSLMQQAEEQSRHAFRSVETFVQAFGSVAMMLESTFYAFHNSVRAVVSVGEQVGRARAHISHIVSALAIVRTLRALYRRLCVWLRLRSPQLDDSLWPNQVDETAPSKSSWPVLFFFAVVLGGPWLFWKLLASLTPKKEESQWASGIDEHFEGVAEYDFESQRPDELSFRRDQRITLAPKQLQPRIRGWLLASVDGKRQGYVPANHIKVVGKRPGTRQLAEQCTTGDTSGFDAGFNSASSAPHSENDRQSLSRNTSSNLDTPPAMSLPVHKTCFDDKDGEESC